MNALLMWSALAAASVIAPGGGNVSASGGADVFALAGADVTSPAERPARPALSGPGLSVVAMAAVVLICLVTLGPLRGAGAAAVCAPVTRLVALRLHARRPGARLDAALPLTLDLMATVIRSGQPVAAALTLAAPVAHPTTAAQLNHVAGSLRLGAEPTEAWRALVGDERLTTLALVAQRSSASGVRLAAALEQLAGDLRRQLRASAEARAQRAGVLAMAPLGLCFLPAFICLGVVPDVIGIARDALGGLG